MKIYSASCAIENDEDAMALNLQDFSALGSSLTWLLGFLNASAKSARAPWLVDAALKASRSSLLDIFQASRLKDVGRHRAQKR